MIKDGPEIDQILSTNRIFKNRGALEQGFVLKSIDEIQFRGELKTHIAHKLKPAVTGNVPDHQFIFGKPGIGKTLVTKLMCNRVINHALNNGKKCMCVYLFCRAVRTPVAIYQAITMQICEKMGVLYKSKGRLSDNYRYFCNTVDSYDGTIIIILDEADKMSFPDIINDISRIKECGNSSKNVCLICITNDFSFYERLEPSTQSSIFKNTLKVRPYTYPELRAILESRAKMAFFDGVMTSPALDLCAAKTAGEYGDARRGISLMKCAAVLVDEEGAKTINYEDIDRASECAEEDILREEITYFPKHEKLVLLAAAFADSQPYIKNESQIVHSLYTGMCSIIGMEPQKTRKINLYIKELDTLGIFNVSRVSKGRGKGTVNAFEFNYPSHLIINALLELDSFECLKDSEFQHGMNKCILSITDHVSKSLKTC